MKCGHVANALDENKLPVCAICIGIKDGATTVEKVCSGTFVLEERTAKCVYGDKFTESTWGLPFFEYCPEEKYDKYYCGCYGWD